MRKVFLFSISLVLFGCVKPEPEEVVSLPSHFSLEGTLNGEAFNMTPGENGFYLFTDLADHNQGRVDFAATAAHLTDDLAPWISFELIMDGDEDDFSEDLIDDIEEGELAIGMEPLEEYDVVLYSDNDFTFWSLDDEVVGEGNEFEFGSLNTETITCSTLDCLNEIEIFPINVIECTSSPTFNVINIEQLENGLFALYPPETNNEMDFLAWDVNGETYNTFGNEPLLVEAPGSGVLDVQLFGGFLQSNPYFVVQSFVGFIGDCSFPWIESGIISEEEPIMRVTYYNGNEQLYTSELMCDPDVDQLNDAFFEVLSMEDFNVNENGLPTKKMTFSTKLLLKTDLGNPFGEILELEIEEGSVAFPYHTD